MCNIIVYLAVDKDGQETMFNEIPVKYYEKGFYSTQTSPANFIELPSGTIKKLTGKDITWENDYIEYVGDNYDPTID